MNDTIRLFNDFLNSTELRKVDFKRDQYLLSNETLKSEFVKDILCIANSAGEDGYIILGVKAIKGKPKELKGVLTHHNGSDLEQLVNSIIEEPIQFEYHPLEYKGLEYGLIHIPKSKSKPHWPKKDFGILRKHGFYTRRASGNREASMPEIREMFLTTIHISDIAQRKIKSSPHVVDELSNMDFDERRETMYGMLKTIAPKIGLSKLTNISYQSRPIFTVVSRNNTKLVANYTIVMHPWTAIAQDIKNSRYNVANSSKIFINELARESYRERLKTSTLIHIAYMGISIKPLESKYYTSTFYQFTNGWKLDWGRVMKWEGRELKWIGKRSIYETKAKFEFFLPDVTSKEELQERLSKLLGWIDENVIDQKLKAK